ncbi:MAG: hypothetical protein JST65_13020 [Acidobacteria bacterium]|nr:hypothetical protein [Acidobacteriota bacterium]
MPKIRFDGLPQPVWLHLMRRAKERRISREDLVRLQRWALSEPFAPDGDWYKDFGSFILCGSGPYPKTVLEKGMKPFGNPID